MNRISFEVGLWWLAYRQGARRINLAWRTDCWAVARYLPVRPFFQAIRDLPAGSGLPSLSFLWRQVGRILVATNSVVPGKASRSKRARDRARAWLAVQRSLLGRGRSG